MTVTELTRARAARGGEARWTPERAGILNVWRYYDEVFEFHRGRLLLRGPNGSGKSKVLELLLPYVLDASLKPSRLSTFGGAERTMHWNLMGDGAAGVTRAGFVWLEFRHADGRWFTCGARLQATVHTTNVTASYFTLTGARIGVPGGIRLTGDGGHPLTRAQLAEELGEAGTVHESAEAYRAVVRRTLYPRLNEQRYDALLTALRQLRTPKLSERLDPGLLSDLLSSALPPLGEDELRDLADGFERLERQREELRLLDRDVAETDRLAARQRDYARRVLRAAAAAVLETRAELDARAEESAARRAALREAEEELRAATLRLGEEEARELALAARIDGLKESEAYRGGNGLHRLREEARRAHEAAAALRDQAGAAARAAAARERLSLRAAAAARAAAALADRARAEARDAARRAGLLSAHDLFAEDTPEEAAAAPGPSTREGAWAARELVRAAVSSRAAQIREVRVAALAHEEAAGRRASAERDRDQARDALDAARETRERAGRLCDERLKDLAAALAEWAAGCLHLRLDPGRLAALAGDPGAADEAVAEARIGAAVRMAAREHQLTTVRDNLAKERAELAAERLSLDERAVLPPRVPHTRAPAAREGRPGTPLWRAVGFRPGVDHGVQAAVEAALEASGLLDLWLLPDGGFAADWHDALGADGHGGFGADGHDAFAVAALSCPAPGPSLADVLLAEPGSPAPVEAVLAAVAYAPTATGVDHPAVIGADGTWRLGPAAGRWAKPEPSYVGAAARERARRRRIAELDERLSDVAGLIAECGHLLTVLAGDRDALAAELRRRPDRGPYDAAARALDAAVAKVALLEDRLRAGEERLRGREAEVVLALRRVTEQAAAHALPTALPALDGLEEALRAAETAAAVRHERRADARAARELAAYAAETAREYEDLAVRAVERAEEAAASAITLAERLAAVESAVGPAARSTTRPRNDPPARPAIGPAMGSAVGPAAMGPAAVGPATGSAAGPAAVEPAAGPAAGPVAGPGDDADRLRVLEGLHDAQAAHRASRRLVKSLNEDLARLNARLGRLQGELAASEEKHAGAERAYDAARARFHRLTAGHLPSDAALPPGAAEAPAGPVEAARRLADHLGAVPYEPRHLREAETRLRDAVHHAREALAHRATLELAHDDDVQVLTASTGGARTGVAALAEALRAERDARTSGGTQAERDLFDRMLGGATRRHLADRVRQATALVEDMNRRLERVRTASRLAVRLAWQVDPAQPAGTRHARDLLLRDPSGLDETAREALYAFFRDRVEEARADDSPASWEDQLAAVLDYTSWHRFTVRLDRGDGQGWQDLTRKLHGALSGGEKAIALHLPLFAAVAAHYQADPGCPRFILLDEVFVGVDRTNRGQVFELLVDLGLDLVLTSDHEWCDYRELDGIAIHQLITGDGDDAVTTARFVWNGHRTAPTDPG
ncbi:Chromosome partition protein Smc [Nonomuraea coxensis DSM 45129]|uniref:Chromosome partition protein Smc n=1 Tax=Nonomuraea coxensis DSM 45129 TaxID=1122611 RepID=A0ABX8U0C8_9ACTN|nr:TIGR02680 family protein [Nonomuraea coxensis]QYC41196.1 Chromosome partition protein Smc [Nonomuraea coxensis DSM 45129]